MNKIFTLAAILGSVSSLSAQSLYDLAPEADEASSLPLTYVAGVNFGIDDNPTPLLAGGEDNTFYGQAYVGASFLNQTAQTTLAVGAQIGVIHYFDNLDVPGVDVDDSSFTVSAYLNWTKRISDRLRFVSSNSIAYELEPDYSTGFQSQRQNGNYLRWSTDNAIGYRWSERFATYTGIRFDGIIFDDIENADRDTFTLYNDFRYQVSERTVATLTYRYSDTSGDGFVSDSSNQFILAGIEHRFSPNTTGIFRGGVQLRDVDSGSDTSNFYGEASFRTQVNEQFSIRAYGRYGVEDFARAITDSNNVLSVYSDSDALRLGFTADYIVSQKLSLTGGVNYVDLGYDDLQATNNPALAASSLDEELLNVFVGFDYQVTESLSVNARYNYEDLSSDAAGRDYDRNRYSVGARVTF